MPTSPLRERDLAGMVEELLGRQPVVGLAVGVVRDGHATFHAHGLADVASQTPVTEDAVFRIASITKTFTAIAVMQLWERGLIDLDAPAAVYLRSFRLVPHSGDHRPATVRHLLTHTAGLPEVARPWGAFMPDFGESVKAGRPLPSLAEFYGGSIRLRAEPGTRFVYGNHSPATLGQIVEDVSGEPLDRYFRKHIFTPLGMSGTAAVRSEPIASRLATGYEIRSTGVRLVTERDMVTTGAASIFSTPRDMARYLAALLDGGAGIIEPETLATMYEPHYRPDPRIPGMGLGFFRTNVGGHLLVGHQGSHPGFHSQIFVAPEAGVGVMAFTNGARQADFWLPGVTRRLLGHLIGAEEETIRSDVAHRPEIWDDIRGWYRLSAGPADVRLRGMMGAGVEVFVRGGRPMVRFLTPIPALAKGFEPVPDDPLDPYAFRIDVFGTGLDSMKMVFGQDASGVTTRVCFDLMPLVLEKRPEATNPRRWATAALGAGAAAAVARMRRR